MTKPTCTEDGFTTYTCICGDSYAGTQTNASGHKWGSWETVKAPTEKSEGTAERVCSACKAKESKKLDKIIPSHTHSYAAKVTKEPTCAAEGIMTYTCTCGGSYTESIAKLSHTYTAVVTQPTCTTQGYTTHTCSRCAYSYTDSKVSATGHIYKNSVTKPTCTADGYTTHTCTVCSYRYSDTRISATGHFYQNTVTKATCTSDGYTTHTCTVCSYSYIDSKTSATGHRYTVTATTAATCTSNGSKTYTCSNCGDSYAETVPGGHRYEDAVTAPTCTEEGYTTHTCSVCGDSYQDSTVAATGHTWGSWRTVWPTCTEDGYSYRSCSCGATETEEGNAAYGHRYAISAEQNGKFVYTCSRCGDSYMEDLDTRYDASLAVPEVASVFTQSSYISINCYATFEKDSGYGYQCLLARDAEFTKGILSDKEDHQWNSLGYTKHSYFYASGSYYYKVRSYKMEGDTFVYGPWSEIGTVSCMNYRTKLDKEAQYTYDIYFVDNLGTDVYTDNRKAIYIKTDNPNTSSVRLLANGQSILGSISSWGKAQYYDDVEYLDITDNDEQLHKVPGGYLGILNVETAGKLTVEVRETSSEGYIIAKSFQLNVLDYETERNNWIDNVIATQTNASMNPKEKMDAISAFLSNGQFKYLTNADGMLVTLAAQPNTPWFLSKRWDSCTSPAMLAVFAERIGGFEEIHNCYGDYSYGSSGWYQYHYMTYVVYNGEKYYYTVCPYTPTGDVGTVEMIDFSDTSALTKIG